MKPTTILFLCLLLGGGAIGQLISVRASHTQAPNLEDSTLVIEPLTPAEAGQMDSAQKAVQEAQDKLEQTAARIALTHGEVPVHESGPSNMYACGYPEHPIVTIVGHNAYRTLDPGWSCIAY